MSNQVYFDMDGVIADFDAYLDRNKLVKGDMFSLEFVAKNAPWMDLPPIYEGVDVLNELIRHDDIPVTILTSTGGGPTHPMVIRQKAWWLSNNGFGDLPVAFAVNTTSKGRFATRGAVLIDDRLKVCQSWKKHGGAAILFTRENAELIPGIVRATLNVS